MNIQVKESLLALAIVSASSAALAIEPAPVDMGGFDMIPTLNFSTGYDDNPFSQTTRPDDSFVTVVNPNLQFVAQQGESVYSLDVGVTHGIFHDSSDDNYTDFNIGFNTNLVFDSKNSLNLNAGYLDGHEDRGSGASQGISDFIAGPTEYHDTTFGGKYTYGSESSQGRLEFSADYLSKVFDNFITLNLKRDRNDYSVAARFLYAVGGDTDVTFEVKNTVVDYNRQQALRDSDELEYFVGLEWQATAKTSGYAKIGAGDKDFDSTFNTDPGTEVSWDVGVTWEPRSYSTVDIYTSREEEETVSTGTYIDTTVYGISWNHGWTEQVSTNLSYNIREEEYVGSNQDDDTDSYAAGIKYAFDRWLDIGLTYDYSDKSSSINILEYDRSKVILSFDISL